MLSSAIALVGKASYNLQRKKQVHINREVQHQTTNAQIDGCIVGKERDLAVTLKLEHGQQ